MVSVRVYYSRLILFPTFFQFHHAIHVYIEILVIFHDSHEVIDNGEDAIEAVKNNKYDVVLMDVHLPGINGTIATQTIRTFDKKTKIIALTAISLNENREMLLSYGMNDVITKPFKPDEFYKAVAQNLAT